MDSQLMEILLDVNDDPRMLTSKHYDITSPSLRARRPELTPDGSHIARRTDPSIKLSDLERDVTHTVPDLPSPSVLPLDLHDTNFPLPGYMLSDREDEYVAAMDSALDALPLPSLDPDKASNGNAVLDPNVDIRPRHTDPPTSEDFAHENPVSVHNWLRRHQPASSSDKEREKLKAPERDKDKDSERGGRSPAPGGTPAATSAKRKAKDKVKKEDMPFEGLDDEIGFNPAEEAAALGSNKKKKNDDDAYRPKGGRTKASAKRKRDRESAGGEGEGSSAKKIKKTGPEAEA